MVGKFRKYPGLAIVGGFILALVGCAYEPENITANMERNQNTQEVNMLPDTAFLNIQLNYDNETPCTPAEPDDPYWQGILINAPKKVYLNTGSKEKIIHYDKVPICGFSMIEILKVKKAGGMKLVVTDTQSGERFEGIIDYASMDAVSNIPDPNHTPFTDEELTGLVSGGAFNPNLTDFVAVPKKPGKYDVQVILGQYRSNTVQIEIVEKPQQQK